MNRIKKLLAAFLAAVLIISACPLSALAEETERIPTEEEIYTLEDMGVSIDDQEYIDSISDEKYWEQFDLSGSKTMTNNGISFTVEWSWNAETKTLYFDMPDTYRCFKYTFEEVFEYERYYRYSDLEREEFGWEGDGEWVTLSFRGYNMEHIIVGNHVETISHPLDNIEGALKDITFEENSSLNSVSNRFLSNATDISITLPDSLETLGNSAFAESDIKSLTIPSSVTKIGRNCFCEAVIGTLDLSGVQTDSLPDYCFYDAHIKNQLTLPSNLKTVGKFAFRGFIYDTLVLPPSTETLGNNCFWEANINKIDLSDTQITEIPYACFSCITNSPEIVFPQGVTAIGEMAFHEGIYDEIVIPSTVETIGTYCFDYSQIRKIDLSALQITEIPEGTFCDISGIEEIILPANITSLGDNAFNGITIDTFVVPSTVTTLGEMCFENAKIKTLDLSQTQITAIPDYCFRNMENVEEILLPNSIETVGNGAFSYFSCSSLTLPSSVTAVGEGCFSYSDIDRLDLSATQITVIPASCFTGMKNINAVILPDGIDTIETGAYSGYQCDTLVMPSNIKKLGEGYFENAQIRILDLSQTQMTEIPANCFKGMKNVEEIRFPNTIQKIGAGAFENMEIASLSIPSGVNTIGENCFKNIKVQNSLTLENTEITEIPDYCFASSSAGSIILPAAVESIGKYAFEKSEITGIFIPSSVLTIGESAFKECRQLQSIDLSGTNVKTLTNTFVRCSSLSELRLPESLKTFSDAATGCTSVTSLVLPEGIVEATGLPDNLKSVNLPVSLKKIGRLKALEREVIDFSEHTNGLVLSQSMFEGNTHIKEVILPKRNLKTIPAFAFKNCTNLERVKLYGCESINQQAFYGSGIKSIELPDNCTDIYFSAFLNCEQLESVRLPKSLEVFGESNDLDEPKFFDGCTNLKTVVIPCTELFGPNSRYDDKEEQALEYYAEQGFLMQNGLKVYVYPDTPIQRYCEANNVDYAYIDWEIEDILPVEPPVTPEEPEEPEEPEVDPFTMQGTFAHGTWSITENIHDPLNYRRRRGLIIECNDNVTLSDRSLTCDNGYETTIEDLLNRYEFDHIFFTGTGSVKIADNYMYGFSALTNNIFCVSFDTNVTEIGENAFRNANINGVWMEDNVADVGIYAFANNRNLTHIRFSSSLTDIKEGVFYNTRLVHSRDTYEPLVEIPRTVLKVGKKAFASYNLRNATNSTLTTAVTFTIEGANTVLYEDPEKPWENAIGVTNDGYVDKRITLLVDKDTPSYRYVKDYGIKYRLRNGEETEEEQNAPPKYNIAPPEDPVIEFDIDSGLLGVDGSKPNYSIGSWSYRQDTKTLFIKSNSYATLNNLRLYYENGNKEEIDLSKFEVDRLVLSGSFTTLYGKAYADKQEKTSSLSKYSLPLSDINPRVLDYSGATIKYLRDGAFENCTRLENLVIPAGATLGENLFENTPSLRGIEIKNRTNIPKDFLNGKTSLEFVKLPENLYNIGPRAFAYCTNLQQIEIPDSCVVIGLKAFYKCVNVQSVTLGTSLNQISKDAFGDLAYCERVTVNTSKLRTDESVTGINLKEQFSNIGVMTNGITVEYCGDITSADFSPFADKNITKIKLGKNVSELRGIQYLDNLNEIEIEEGNSTFTLENGILYKGTELVLAPRKLGDITVKADTTKVGDYAFYKTNAKIVKLPNTVTKIGVKAFADSDSLKSITMNKGVASLGNGAFENCKKLRTVLLPNGLRTIGERAFAGCVTLASAIFDEQLITIQNEAFEGCTALKGIVIPESVATVGDRAFKDCETLEYAYIWDCTLGEDVFKNDTLLVIYTMLASTPYEYAKLNNIEFTSYTDEDAFFTECALKIDVEAGYLGYCNGEHGDIEWLTVYEADCENDGYMIGVCEYCSEILDERHIDAYGHEYSKVYETPSTASVRGGALYTCSRCHTSKYEYSDEAGEGGQTVTTQSVTGKVVIAEQTNATEGRSPAKRAWIMNGENKIAETNENGEFSIALESGVYYLKIHYAFGFDRYITVVVQNEDVDCGSIAVIGTDFNKNGLINDEEVRLFRIALSAVKNDPSYLDYVDLNNDGYINAKDYVILLRMNGLKASEYEYSELVFT